MFPLLLFLGALGAVAAAAGVANAKSSATSSTSSGTGKLSATIVALAKKWAAQRGIPAKWVLGTIYAESRGNPNAVGDQGRSIGLMQVNSEAHASELAAQGLNRESLFNPEINIMFGTQFMREIYDRIVKENAGRVLPAPIDVLVRLAYISPAAVYKAVKDGVDPRPARISSTNAWQDALSQTSALV